MIIKIIKISNTIFIISYVIFVPITEIYTYVNALAAGSRFQLFEK